MLPFLEFLLTRIALFLLISGSALAEDEVPKFQTVQKQILNTRCISCHGVGGGFTGVDLTSYAKIVTHPPFSQLMIPGNSKDSVLFQVVSSGQMPPSPNAQLANRLSNEQVTIIQKWIELGALNN
jgi:uncharacterized membrane protein